MNPPPAPLATRLSTAERTLHRELDELHLLQHLEDPALENVRIRPDGAVYLSGSGAATTLPDRLEAGKVRSLVHTIAGVLGKPISPPHFLEGDLPLRGIRVTVVLPPISTDPTLVFRLPAIRRLTLADLCQNQTVLPEAHQLLLKSLEAKHNLLISGGTNSGKTTLLSALLQELVRRDPELEICVIEETARELPIPGTHVVSLCTDPSTPLHSLLPLALRFNVQRIIVGEARGPEALPFLEACNTGHPGSMMTLHANSALHALQRLDTLVQRANVPSQMPLILEAVDTLVHLHHQSRLRFISTIHQVDRSTAPPVLRALYQAQA